MRNARPHCPNPECENHSNPPVWFYRKRGYRRTQHDHQRVPIYQCRACGRRFSATQTRGTFHQHRPDLNQQLFRLAVSGVSMRRMELLLGCSRRTIERKVLLLARQAKAEHAKHLAEISTSYIMLDELETFIHAKYRQVSVPVVVRVKTGEILALNVCRIPSSSPMGGAGTQPLPPGVRPDTWTANDRPRLVPAVLETVRPCLKPMATIASDGDASYPKWIRLSLPGVQHQVLHSPRENSLGRARKKASGEPRETDPLFAINVLFAKMRNDLARLARRTWTTSKSIEGLRRHLWLYVAWNNGYRLR